MLVVMQAHATDEQVRAVCQRIESMGYRAHAMPGAQRTAIGITGNKGEVEPGTLEEMAGVQELIRVSKPDRVPSRAASRLFRWPSAYARRARSFSAVEPTSRAPLHILSRDWKRQGCVSWQKSGSSSG